MQQDLFGRDRLDLMRTLQESGIRIERLMRLSDEKENLEQELAKLNTRPASVSLLTWGMYAFAATCGIAVIMMIKSPIDGEFGTAVAWLLLATFTGLFALALRKVNLKRADTQPASESASRRAEHINDRLATIQSEGESLAEWYETECPVPEEYRDPDVIDMLAHYLRTGRADTWRQCVNLLHQEMEHQERLQSLEDLRGTVEEFKETVSTQLDEIEWQQQRIRRRLER